KGTPLLSREDREVLGEIFLLLLLQRFKTKSREELRKMIAELTPLHETRAGKELLEEGIERGLKKGVKEGIERGMAKGRQKGVTDLVRRMLTKGRTPAEIADLTDLSVAEITRLLAEDED
ncbi:MAG: Rpn family recombination-promoting nuclease/putative transposase, partial [Verrucomicrobiaceae bacterium]|nr:Rpn family recombination-promoting nuclease/putative transposase [Verrucomicrobiaceae bacterium]